ncbi:general substrate transporter [Aspergillus sclerotioniger CBS 115572]|uniref:General substrate transporter n=1 Tax=Aspergillus sclerotioniger CBS 115572 TaxID=1450535 RepID=A0A317WWL6_9EURO|nr:general substrate transporter [Aspergillus sclerotioniger CBS 115572]PWY89702.1 general substrate transporter [Aspergillus sclerotioniger CBS 115572]
MMSLRGKPLVYLVTVVSSTGFCLFGYDNGLMGQVISEPSFLNIVGNPDAAVQGFAVSSYDIGCMLGALAALFISEQIGRKQTILLACIVHLVGDVINASSYSLAQFLVSRIILGIGLGLFTSASPVWLAETATAQMRAVMVAVQLTFLIIGTNIAYWVDYGLGFLDNEISWRVPFALQAIYPILAFAFTLFLPESPRWLASHGQTEAAAVALSAFRDLPEDHEMIRAELQDIASAIALEADGGSWSALFRQGPNKVRTRVIIACAANAMQSYTGINFVEYYFPYILTNSVGLSTNLANLVAGCSQVWFLLSSFLTWYYINKLGRRRLFYLGNIGMGCCMVAVCITLWKATHVSAILTIVFFFIYLSFFTWGWMSNMWTYPAEIVPLHVRGKAMALSVIFQFSNQFWTVEIAPVSIDSIGWRTYIIWAVLNFACCLVVYLYFPETSALTLESVDFLFSSSNNIREVVARSENLWSNHYHLDVGAAAAAAGSDGKEKAMEAGAAQVSHIEEPAQE